VHQVDHQPSRQIDRFELAAHIRRIPMPRLEARAGLVHSRNK
jgi:hypothetical protein